jgi:hypothetical protein
MKKILNGMVVAYLNAISLSSPRETEEGQKIGNRLLTHPPTHPLAHLPTYLPTYLNPASKAMFGELVKMYLAFNCSHTFNIVPTRARYRTIF